MQAKCGHLAPRSYANTHNGLCRRCHANFSFLLDMEDRYGEDVVIEYWYAKILIHLSDDIQATNCFIDHLVDFYSKKLHEVSANKQPYVRKMLYMLNSLKEPFDNRSMV